MGSKQKIKFDQNKFPNLYQLSQLIHSSLSQEPSESIQQSKGQGLNKELFYLGPLQSLSQFNRTGIGIPVYRRGDYRPV